MKTSFYTRIWNWLLLLSVAGILSCEKNFDIKLDSAQQLLIVEGYINNEIPEYNYVVLSRSQDYYAPDFQSLAVSNATVTITEGVLLPDQTYSWDAATKVQLREANQPQVPDSLRQGVYFDPRLFTSPSQALRGTTGKYYLLEIETDGKHYSSVTGLLQPVILDSISSDYHFIDAEDNNKPKARITAYYQDPDTIGNTQMYFWRYEANRNNFGWAGLSRNRRANGADDLTNGQYIKLTQNQGFAIGDTVHYFLMSVERKVYNFWESYDKARDNEGPFATPVTLQNTITGENVLGCFSGFSVSSRQSVVK
jgi:hypothetical protein